VFRHHRPAPPAQPPDQDILGAVGPGRGPVMVST